MVVVVVEVNMKAKTGLQVGEGQEKAVSKADDESLREKVATRLLY